MLLHWLNRIQTAANTSSCSPGTRVPLISSDVAHPFLARRSDTRGTATHTERGREGRPGAFSNSAACSNVHASWKRIAGCSGPLARDSSAFVSLCIWSKGRQRLPCSGSLHTCSSALAKGYSIALLSLRPAALPLPPAPRFLYVAASAHPLSPFFAGRASK